MAHQVIDNDWTVTWEGVSHKDLKLFKVQVWLVLVFIFIKLAVVSLLGNLKGEFFCCSIHACWQIVCQGAIVAWLVCAAGDTVAVFVRAGRHHARSNCTSIIALLPLIATSCHSLRYKEIHSWVSCLHRLVNWRQSALMPQVTPFRCKNFFHCFFFLFFGHGFDNFRVCGWEYF